MALSAVSPAVSSGLEAVRTEQDPLPSPDFAAVSWQGRLFCFSRKQRVVVGQLFQAREKGYHFVSQDHLLKAADSDCHRLRDLFRGHPAWGDLIVSEGRGLYRLSPMIEQETA
jgi:hypothetical protein